MYLVDTNCHLDSEFFDVDRDEVVERARIAGGKRIIIPAIRFKNIPKVLALTEQYGGVYAAVGIYPRYCMDWQAPDIGQFRQAARHKRVVAIGEIGLDYSWNNRCSPKLQQRVFAEQLKLAADLDLPVIVHNFQSYTDCLQLIAESTLMGRQRIGVLHHFTADYDTVRRAMELGLLPKLRRSYHLQEREEIAEITTENATRLYHLK